MRMETAGIARLSNEGLRNDAIGCPESHPTVLFPAGDVLVIIPVPASRKLIGMFGSLLLHTALLSGPLLIGALIAPSRLFLSLALSLVGGT